MCSSRKFALRANFRLNTALAMQVRTAAILWLLAALAGCAVSATPMRGQYYWGHEVETFHPCGSDQAYWVVGSQSLLLPLRTMVDKVVAEKATPYQPIYVEIAAESEGKATDGFAEEYDGVINITRVLAAREQTPDDCAKHR